MIRGVFLFVKKISIIIFILGVLISLFSGAFPVLAGLQDLKIVVLLILGLLVGLLNISEKEQTVFLMSSLTFLFSAKLLLDLSSTNFVLLNSFFLMLQNLMIFIAPSALVISLKIVFSYASESEKQFSVDVPSPKERHFLENAWDVVVFFGVALVMVILVLESFFDLSVYPGLNEGLQALDFIVLGIFLIDLLVIFKHTKSVTLFLKKNWIDIIAVLPLGTVFRAAKVVRAVRIVKMFSKAEKAAKGTSKLLKANRGFKIFSKDSGFNKIMHPELANVSKSKKINSSKKKKATKKTSKKKK